MIYTFSKSDTSFFSKNSDYTVKANSSEEAETMVYYQYGITGKISLFSITKEEYYNSSLVK